MTTTASSEFPPLAFREQVARRPADTALRKGERTRERIRLAAIDVLNEVGFREMKVGDVCERAGVSPPVLYLYFPGKTALVEEVLKDFLESFMDSSVSATRSKVRTAYEAIRRANLNWLRAARANAGLIRCLLQYSDEAPEFARLFADFNRRWYLRIADAVLARFPAAAAERGQIALAAYALGGMMDELARKLFVQEDAGLRAVVDAVAPGDEALADFVSVLWHRALYRADPAGAGPVLADLARAAAG